MLCIYCNIENIFQGFTGLSSVLTMRCENILKLVFKWGRNFLCHPILKDYKHGQYDNFAGHYVLQIEAE